MLTFKHVIVCLLFNRFLFIYCRGDSTAAAYLYNCDRIIYRQLEEPLEEDSEDLKDNVDEYVRLLEELLKSVRKKDPVALETAHQYWTKGIPSFFQEDKNGDIFKKLTDEFEWSLKEARALTNLIDKARFLWSSFDTWYKERNRAFRQF